MHLHSVQGVAIVVAEAMGGNDTPGHHFAVPISCSFMFMLSAAVPFGHISATVSRLPG